MKFLYSLAFILGSIHNCLAATQLGAFGAVTYEAGHGFPATVPIIFETDFTAVDTGSEAVGNVFFNHAVSGNGAAFFASNALAVNSQTQFTITFTRNGDTPEIGIYTVSIAVDMMYKNSAGDTLMHEKTYEITINLSGTTATQTLQVAGTSNGYTETTDTGATNADTIESLPPGDLGLSQTNGPVSFGTDIALSAATADTTYDVWWNSAAAINVYSDAGYSAKVYEWPVPLVTGLNEETGSSESVAITLRSVPVALYNLGNIYISLGVTFRDTAGDRRALRMSALESGRALERKEEGNAELATQVKFDNAEDSAAAATAMSFLAMTAGAMAAALAFI